MTNRVASKTASRREEREPETRRRDRADGDELHDPLKRDLLDAASDSWRDLEFLAMLDEIGSPPDEDRSRG